MSVHELKMLRRGLELSPEDEWNIIIVEMSAKLPNLIYGAVAAERNYCNVSCRFQSVGLVRLRFTSSMPAFLHCSIPWYN